jgi:enoyl-CoA hydratase/carnithine racemase
VPAFTREDADGIALVRFDRPPVNAIDRAVTEELGALAGALERAPPKALVLTGSGATFSAGLDLKAVPAYGLGERRALVLSINRMVRRLYGLPCPTVAAVNGHAMAGGLVLALGCDLRLAAAGAAKLALSEVNVGIPFPLGPMLVVNDTVGGSARRDLALFGRVYDPATALAAGLVDEIVPAERLLARARERARELAGLRGYAVIKAQLRAATLAELDRAIAADDDPVFRRWA